MPSYLSLAEAIGDNFDARAWEQISEALASFETDERGAAGYAAFTTYARSLIKPVADYLGWDAKTAEAPDVRNLRRIVLTDLGTWGDT